jgi:tRNA threonylcarbamoyladenosine modification (KEOPS) complex Cgi121 subunit
MSFAREVMTLRLRGPFGSRALCIAGGRGNVADTQEFLGKMAAIDDEVGTTSQVFDASLVAGPEHLVHAARSALTAHATGRNLAGSLRIELMCWAAAERQIGRAFEKMGLRRGVGELAFVVVARSRTGARAAMGKIFRELGVERDDGVLGVARKKVPAIRRAFSISSEELEVAPLEKLVLERIALLALAR